jgi:MFS family permease
MRFSPTPWLVATLAFVILGFTRGLHSSFGVFYVALLDTFGWSRGATAGVFSMVLTVDAILSPVVGYLLDRFGTKKIVCSGCFILALGLLLSSTIDSLWQLYIFFGLISAVGITFTGMVPHVFLVSEWFIANRASAIGFVYAGTGVGILLLAPLSELVLSSWGWPRAFQMFSGIVLILLLPLVWVFYQHGPFGEKLRSKKESKPDDHRWTAKLALRSWQVWLLFFARICAASGTTVIVTHQVAHVVDVGYSKLLAAMIFGLAGITSSFGRVVFGFIADLLTKQAAYTLNILMTLVGVGALMILRDPSQTWLLYVYVIFLGLASALAQLFSPRSQPTSFPAKDLDRSSATRRSLLALAERWAPGWGAHSMIGPAAIWSPLGSRRWFWPALTSAYGWLLCHRSPVGMSDSLGRLTYNLTIASRGRAGHRSGGKLP